MTATRILLVRHGESTWNAAGRWQGQADPPLSAAGEAQARSAAAHLPDIDAVVASDLERARVTAGLLVAGIDPPLAVEVWPGLREIDVGQWSGLTRAEIAERWPGTFDRSRPGELVTPPGGEGVAAFTARAVATLHRLAERHPGARVLAVSHGGLIRHVDRHMGEPLEKVPNLAGRWIEVDNGHLTPGPRVLLVEPTEAPITVPQQL